MMKSKQLLNETHTPGMQPGGKLAPRQQQLIAEVLPQLSVQHLVNRGVSHSIRDDLKQESIKQNMKTRLKDRLGIKH